MSEQDRPELTSLHFDLKTRRLVGLLSDESALQFTLTPELRLFYDGRVRPSEATQRSEIVHQPETPATTEKPTTPERQPVQTLTGRLKDDVKPGRVDSRGNPTSWAIAAVHQEGSDEAKMVAVTFHRHTTQLALDNLKKDDQVTLQGYLRPAAPPKPGEPARMDAFSAFHLINWPGKPEKE